MFSFFQKLDGFRKSFSRHAERSDVATEKSGKSSTREEQAAILREKMVQQQLVCRDIHDEGVLQAMRSVPRHHFVPQQPLAAAYADKPLPIGHEQTISQPYIVALMTQIVMAAPQGRALDVGTGSGYQAAILAKLMRDVQSVEIVPELAEEARQRLSEMQCNNVTIHHGDGRDGWNAAAPYDVIVAACSPEAVPAALLQQLAPQGHLVMPIGDKRQFLMLYKKQTDGTVRETRIVPVAFVPMIDKKRNGPQCRADS